MRVFRFNKASGIARNAKASLNPEGGITRGAAPDADQHEGQPEDPTNVQATHG